MCKTNGQLFCIIFFAKKHCFKRSQSIKLCMSPSNTWTGTAVRGAADICSRCFVVSLQYISRFLYPALHYMVREDNAQNNNFLINNKNMQSYLLAKWHISAPHPNKLHSKQWSISLCYSKYHLKRHLADQIRTKFCIKMYI